MIENLIFGLMKLGDIFERSRDPDLEEFREKQRLAIVASTVAVLTFLMALLIDPSQSQALGQFAAEFAAIRWYLTLGLLGTSLIACLVVTWVAYGLSK